MKTHQPQMFGKYRVIKPLGQGGFAQVYQVEDENGNQWALKRLHENLIKQDLPYQEQFEREANIQKDLHHPNIVGVHDFDAKEGYLVLDYVDGGETLQTIVNEDYPEGMDFDTVFKILEPLEKALMYINDANLAHLDLTPKNILIQKKQIRRGEVEWNVRLADFGLARMVDLDGNARGGVSLYGSGTPGFRAPEQINPVNGKRPGSLSDIYSLGLVIGVMLTGRAAEEVLDILLRMNTSMLPLEVKQVLQRAINEDPDRRYANAKGLVKAFTQVVGALDLDRGRTQMAPPGVRGRWQTPSVRPFLDSTKPSSQGKNDLAGASGLKKNVVIMGCSILIALVLLGISTSTLVRSLPAAYFTQLGGVDLGTYCRSLNYQRNNADVSCTSTINLDDACDWQHETSGLHFRLQNPSDPKSGDCYDSHRNTVGGIRNMDNYCKDQRQDYLGMPGAMAVGNTWVCEQQINMTLVCSWQFSRVDVQAHKDDQGNWVCYGFW